VTVAGVGCGEVTTPGCANRRQRHAGSGLAATLVALSALAAPAAGQTEVAVDMGILDAAASAARPLSGGMLLGIEFGLGVPQLDRTLYPRQDSTGGPDYEEFIHVAAFMRAKPGRWLDVDFGIRAALSRLWSCGGDCLPAPAFALYLQPMVGSDRFKVGPRVQAGWVADPEPMTDRRGNAFVSLTPLSARITLRF